MSISVLVGGLGTGILYKVQQFRCYRSGLRHLLGEYGGIEADRQTNSTDSVHSVPIVGSWGHGKHGSAGGGRPGGVR
eukprot:COSAG01_NODE_36001_length_523_cov_21.356132_1_plen_77_part_00